MPNGVSVSGSADDGASIYAIDGRKNASFKAVNLLLGEGASVYRVDSDASGLRAGDFIVTSHPSVEGVADHTGVDFSSLAALPENESDSGADPLETLLAAHGRMTAPASGSFGARRTAQRGPANRRSAPPANVPGANIWGGLPY